MTQETRLDLLHRQALTKVYRQMGSRTFREVGDEELYEIIRESADSLVFGKSGSYRDVQSIGDILLLAVENPEFAKDMPACWTFTSWEESGNYCSPLELIRENIYQWLVSRLESDTGYGQEEEEEEKD